MLHSLPVDVFLGAHGNYYGMEAKYARMKAGQPNPRHVKEAGRAVQHMQKALTKMNIQLANVISDINGLSGQEIIAAILQGDPLEWLRPFLATKPQEQATGFSC